MLPSRFPVSRLLLVAALLAPVGCFKYTAYVPPSPMVLDYRGAKLITLGQRVESHLQHETQPDVYVYRGTPGERVAVRIAPMGFALEWGEEAGTGYIPLGRGAQSIRRTSTIVVPASGALVIRAYGKYVSGSEPYFLSVVPAGQPEPTTAVAGAALKAAPQPGNRPRGLAPFGVLDRVTGRRFVEGTKTVTITSDRASRRLAIAYGSADGFARDRFVLQSTGQPGFLDVVEAATVSYPGFAYRAQVEPDSTVSISYVVQGLGAGRILSYAINDAGVLEERLTMVVRRKPLPPQVSALEPATEATLAAARQRQAERQEQQRQARIAKRERDAARAQAINTGIREMGAIITDHTSAQAERAAARTQFVQDSVRGAEAARAERVRAAQAADGARPSTGSRATQPSSASAPRPAARQSAAPPSAARQPAARQPAARQSAPRSATTGTTSTASATAPGQPLRFVLMVPMGNRPGDKNNPTCYSNIVTRPGPPGWGSGEFVRGSYEQAEQSVLNIRQEFFAACEKSGRKIRGAGNFSWESNQYKDGAARLPTIGPKVPEDVLVRIQ